MKTIKKDKTPGPSTYAWENAHPKSSECQKTIINFNIGGMGIMTGSKKDLKHCDKLKVKSLRTFDQIVINAKKKDAAPGVGHYRNIEIGLDK